MPMYNLIEHSLNKFDTRSSLWFYSKVFMVYYKDKSTNFNTDIYNTDDFKFFKNKAKLQGTRFARLTPNAANVFTENDKVVVTLKHLITFSIPLEMSLINCYV